MEQHFSAVGEVQKQKSELMPVILAVDTPKHLQISFPSNDERHGCRQAIFSAYTIPLFMWSGDVLRMCGSAELAFGLLGILGF